MTRGDLVEVIAVLTTWSDSQPCYIYQFSGDPVWELDGGLETATDAAFELFAVQTPEGASLPPGAAGAALAHALLHVLPPEDVLAALEPGAVGDEPYDDLDFGYLVETTAEGRRRAGCWPTCRSPS